MRISVLGSNAQLFQRVVRGGPPSASRRFRVRADASPDVSAFSAAVVEKAPTKTESASNGVPPPGPPQLEPEVEAAVKAALESDPTPSLDTRRSLNQVTWTNFKLAFALPWRRFKRESAFILDLKGEISDKLPGGIGQGGNLSVPGICEALKKAALDPRINGVVIRISPLGVGWAKLAEIRRHLTLFRQSGKFSIAYMEIAGEKEFYLASAFEEVYCPPSASVSLRGLSVQGQFLRGVLEKVGVEPEVRRIGKYKSAGDQLLRKDMSEPQREQLTKILDGIWVEFLEETAKSRGKTREELEALIGEGVYDTDRLLELGWVTALKYEDDIVDMLKKRTGGKEDEYRVVGYRKYSSVSPSAFGLVRGKKAIAVLRATGGISSALSEDKSGNGITAKSIRGKLLALEKDKRVSAIVLAVNSPGGDALASDLMWETIRRVGAKKPIVCLMGDVAASGGYYMAMGCSKILAEPLTITGSIGVVTGKFNLSDLYNRAGFSKEVISRGKYAQILNESRKFSDEEAELFDRAAMHAYTSFRNKAAVSRGFQPEELEAFAQGRVWTGKDALDIKLIDGLGGLDKAIRVAKALAKIPEKEDVRVLEATRSRPNLGPAAALLGASAGGAGASSWLEADEASKSDNPVVALFEGVISALAATIAAPLVNALAQRLVGSALVSAGLGAALPSSVQALGSLTAGPGGIQLGNTGAVQAFADEAEQISRIGSYDASSSFSVQASMDAWDGSVQGSSQSGQQLF